MSIDNRTVEALVGAAAKSNADRDYERLFAALVGAELFFNISTPPSTSAATAGSKPAPVSTPLVDVGQGLRAILLFTSRENSNLKKPFGGITWQKALEMLIKMPQADGLVLRNNDADWVAIDKARAQMVSDSLTLKHRSA